jgi:hypothetical protein
MARALLKFLAFGATALGVAAVAAACGTDAVGVETCRQIETARCQQAPNCPADINLDVPEHRDSPKTDVDACIRFYRDACLHGLAAAKDPGAVATKACIDAINTGDCMVVVHPETHPSCAWLIPPAPPPVVDAAIEGGDATDAPAQ